MLFLISIFYYISINAAAADHFSSVITGMAAGLVEALIYLLSGIIVFLADLAIELNRLFLLVSAAVACTAAFWALGIISAAVTLITRKGSSLAWLVTALLLFSGDIFFP